MPTFKEDLHLGHSVPTIDTEDIEDRAITEKKMADGSVSTRTIQNGAVTEPKIANRAVTEPKLADWAVSTRTVRDKAISERKLADLSVSTRTMQDKSVINSKIADSTISMGKLDNDVQTKIQQGTQRAWTPKGAYDAEAVYDVNDLVYHTDTNSSYISLQANNQGHNPTWQSATGGWWMKVVDGSYVNVMVDELEQAIAQAIEDAQEDIDDAIADANAAAQAAWGVAYQAVDPTMDETSTNPVQNKVVTDNLTADSAITLSNYPTTKGRYISPSTNNWAVNNGYRYMFVPVEAGKKYRFKANASLYGRYAVMQNNNTSGSAAYATGCSLTNVTVDTESTFTVPENGVYLYIMTQSGNGNHYPQALVEIKKTKDILLDVKEEVDYSNPFFDVSALQQVTYLREQAWLPYFIQSSGTWLVNNNNYAGAMIDVRGCNSLTIANNDTYSLIFALLTTYDVTADATPSYASKSGRTSIAAGAETTVEVTGDAVCLWIGRDTSDVYSQGTILTTITLQHKMIDDEWAKNFLRKNDALYSKVVWTTEQWTSGNVNPTNGNIETSTNASYCRVPLDNVLGFYAQMYHVTTNIGIAFFDAEDNYLSGIGYKNMLKGIAYARVPSGASYMLYTFNRNTYGSPFAGITFVMYANKAAEWASVNATSEGGDSSLPSVVKNMLKKIDQCANIRWTAKSSISQGYIAAGTHQGLPYSSTQQNEGAVDFNISRRTFMTAANNPYSMLYTEDLKHNTSEYGFTYYTGGATVHGYMGAVCSTFSAYAIGMDVVFTTGFVEWLAKQGLFEEIYDQSAQGVDVGDWVLSDGHVFVVSNVARVSGVVESVVIAEAWQPLVRKLSYTPAEFNSRVASVNGIIYRPKELYKNTFYEASPFVAVGDEVITTPYQYNNDICTYKGDYACFREGFPVWINYNLVEVGAWTQMEVYKDDVLVGTYTIDTTTHKFNLTEAYGQLGYGKWKARLTDGTNYSDYTYWEVLQTTVSVVTPDSNNPDVKTFNFSSANGTPVYMNLCSVSGSPRAMWIFSQAERNIGSVTFNGRTLSQQQRDGFGDEDIYVRVFFRGDYGMLSNGGLLTDY